MASQVMRITLKAYDHELVDASAKKIMETVKKNGHLEVLTIQLKENMILNLQVLSMKTR